MITKIIKWIKKNVYSKLFDIELNRQMYLKGLEARKELTQKESSRHWKNGGTGFTNISLTDKSMYDQAVKRLGDPRIVVINRPMLESIPNKRDEKYMGSIHGFGIHDMSAFYVVARLIGSEQR